MNDDTQKKKGLDVTVTKWNIYVKEKNDNNNAFACIIRCRSFFLSFSVCPGPIQVVFTMDQICSASRFGCSYKEKP
jgi:hypothetical protein